MKVEFSKYHGAGNDFIMIDNRKKGLSEDHDIFKHLCDRHFGIGADGLILLENDKDSDFSMKYFNSDGYEGSMCGNGGRCIIFFAHKLKLISNKANFKAIDGFHKGEMLSVRNNTATIRLKMSDVTNISEFNNNLVINTGSPHYLIFDEDIDKIDVFTEGKTIRDSQFFKKEGINIDFIKKTENQIKIRTYERGVENETLACGTGVVASAIASYLKTGDKSTNSRVETLGGNLRVCFKESKGVFTNIYLEGPAKYVYSGEINI